MKSLFVIYFSGTGNSKYVAERMCKGLNYDAKNIASIEEDIDFGRLIDASSDILLVYPIYGGTIPIIMREFLRRYRFHFYGKNLITVITEAGFSGDGGATAIRYLDSDKIVYKASAHIVMPTNVSFGKLVKIKNGDKLVGKMTRANRRIDKVIAMLDEGKYMKTGSSKFAYLLGYHLQRKYFERMEIELRNKFEVDNDKCIGCEKCVNLCPMDNIVKMDGHIEGKGNCTLCYRCLHACPVNAITLIRHEDVQYKGIVSHE